MVQTVLTIAGSDSGAGAGVQADARTIEALGGFAVMAITAITAQNLHGVRSWQATSPRLLADQIDAVFEDFAVNAVKIGLLPGTAAIRAVKAQLAKHRVGRVAVGASSAPGGRAPPLVIDPVIGSTTGKRFLSLAAMKTLHAELFPLATLVTPNWPEAAVLSGLPVTSIAEAERAGQRLLELGCAAVLVKGGHGPGRQVCDVLVTASGDRWLYASERVATKNTHGTGCTLSSAIATRLAQGDALPAAVGAARRYLVRVLRRNRALRWGGRGPVG